MTILSSAEPEENIVKTEETTLSAIPSDATKISDIRKVSKQEISAYEIKKKKDTNTGFKVDEDGTMYYLDGKQIKNCLTVIRNELYHFDKNGYMTIGKYYDKMAEKVVLFRAGWNF